MSNQTNKNQENSGGKREGQEKGTGPSRFSMLSKGLNSSYCDMKQQETRMGSLEIHIAVLVGPTC